jgi:hypothetical protein
MDGLVDLSVVTKTEEAALPEGIGALALLQMVYRGEVELSAQQMRAAIEALPFEVPKLTAVATTELNGQTFAELLDKAIARSEGSKRPPPKLIESKATEVHPASELKGPMPRPRGRRV